MKIIAYILSFVLLLSCKNTKTEELNSLEGNIQFDTTKLYQKLNIIYDDQNGLKQEYEVYVSKKNDTFLNQTKIYKKGILDSSQSKFYDLSITGNKTDSIFDGTISFFSPADSLPKSKIYSRNVSFGFLQKQNDSLIFEEIETDTNVINFKYKSYNDFKFEGFITDLRFFKIDSMNEKLLLNRNYFAIDSEVSTNNVYVELLK